MTVIENINIAYVLQDLVFSVAQMLMEQRTFDISVFAIGCMILPLRGDRRNCLFNGWVNSFRIVLAFFTASSSYRQSICVSFLHRVTTQETGMIYIIYINSFETGPICVTSQTKLQKLQSPNLV